MPEVGPIPSGIFLDAQMTGQDKENSPWDSNNRYRKQGKQLGML